MEHVCHHRPSWSAAGADPVPLCALLVPLLCTAALPQYADVEVLLDEPASMLKAQLYALTLVPVAKQKILGTRKPIKDVPIPLSSTLKVAADGANSRCPTCAASACATARGSR